MTKSWKLTLISFIVVMAMPVVNGPLAEYGIAITEQELQHFLFVFLGVSATGGGLSVYKKHEDRKKFDTMVKVDPQAYITPKVEDEPVPIVKTPTIKTPTVEIPIIETPIIETPIIETPIIETPIIETPIIETPIIETPIIETPIIETPTSTPELGPVGSAYQTNFVKDPQIGNVLQYGEPYLFARMAGARSYVTGLLRDSTGKVIQIEQSVPGEDIIRMELKNKQGQPLLRGIYSLQVQADTGSGDSQGIKRDEFQIV